MFIEGSSGQGVVCVSKLSVVVVLGVMLKVVVSLLDNDVELISVSHWHKENTDTVWNFMKTSRRIFFLSNKNE